MRLNESEWKEKNNVILNYLEKNLNPDTISIIFLTIKQYWTIGSSKLKEGTDDHGKVENKHTHIPRDKKKSTSIPGQRCHSETEMYTVGFLF